MAKTTLELENQLQRLPVDSGVYLFKDAHKNIIYIGKAKSLKKRVSSYFKGDLNSPRLKIMVAKIDFIDFIVTGSEIEALILEDSLIKKNKPRYNVLLKDDKKFPWIMITDENYPRLEIVRKPLHKEHRGKARFFGPYADVGKMRKTLDVLKTIFPLRKRKTPLFKDRPCINYDIGQCLGPCQQLVSVEEYKKIVEQIEMFLTGKQNSLALLFEEKMHTAAQRQEFEKAARYRDALTAILKTQQEQKIVSQDTEMSQDVLSCVSDELRLVLSIFKIREGRIISKDDFEIELEEQDKNFQEYLYRFLRQYYQNMDPQQIGDEIYLDFVLEDTDMMASWLESLKRKKVVLYTPEIQTNPITEMVRQNAELALENFQKVSLFKVADGWNKTGLDIQKMLKLPEFPYRVECFDISHIQGTHTVASMVVFINGKPYKSEYRKFKIKSVQKGKPDDFASMEEVITRRYSALKNSESPFPELIIVDGGKGQLSSAYKALKKLGLEAQPIVALAKKFEEVFVPHRSKPILFNRTSRSMYFFQNIRDEAHRFAVTFHKSLRGKEALVSLLDTFPGIGPQRKKILLDHFKTTQALQNASVEDLASLKGISQSLAEKIVETLQNR